MRFSHPGNRQFMAMQDSQNKPRDGSTGSQRKKRLVLGNRTYTIDDDDISVISPAIDTIQNIEIAEKTNGCQHDSTREPKTSMIGKEGNEG